MALWETIAPCRQPANLGRTIRIALVVGCVLTIINQLDVILKGNATELTGVKIVLNFCVPFHRLEPGRARGHAHRPRALSYY